MAQEIERKFLVEELPPGLERHDRVEIEQGYVALAEDAEVRVRRAGPAAGTLTVKRGSGEAREEYEVALGAEQLEALWPACAGRRLRKRRHLVPLDGGLRAELDVYAGRLEGLTVVEVEFPSPERAAAFRPPAWFGRELTGDPRFANRALALDAGPAMRARRTSRAYRLRRDEDLADGLRRIAAGRARRARQRLRGAEPAAPGFATAVHGARKDLKKLRAVVRLLRDELGEERYAAENGRYRAAARALSASRDAQVMVETLDGLGERGELPAAAVSAWRRVLEGARDRAAASEAAGVTAALELIEPGPELIESWPLGADSWELVDAGVRRAYRRGRRAMREARRDGSAASFHEWRKREKDLWYQLRVLLDAEPRTMGEMAALADRLADLLGDHHDLAVLAADLGRRGFEPGWTEPLAAAIAARQAELAARAFALGERLYAERPKAHRRRLRGYWRAWRAD